MTDPSQALQDVDFEQMYRTVTEAGGAMPWDIGEPQPVLVALEEAGEITGEVIDVGCGLGDNSIFLAGRGYRVTGVDGAPTALELARRRAADKGLDVEFTSADATSLEGFENRFDTAVDSALYHCLKPEERHQYIAALHRACKPGAVLHLFCFSEEVPETFPAPFRISEQNLRETVGAKWEITRLEPTRYAASSSVDNVADTMKDVLPGIEGAEEAVAELPRDDQGRITVPMWQLTARRK